MTGTAQAQTVAFASLGDLHKGNPARSNSLISIGAECRNRRSKEWRAVRRSWSIARASCNDLPDAWTAGTEFRAPIDMRACALNRCAGPTSSTNSPSL